MCGREGRKVAHGGVSRLIKLFHGRDFVCLRVDGGAFAGKIGVDRRILNGDESREQDVRTSDGQDFFISHGSARQEILMI